MRKIVICYAVLAAMSAQGCVSLPPTGLAAAPTNSPTDHSEVEAVVHRIICEIERSPDYGTMRRLSYTAAISLQVTTMDSSGFTPALSFIHPLHIASTSQSTILGGELSATAQHQYTQTFEIKIAQLPEAPPASACNNGHSRNDLAGNIGLSDVIAEGLRSYPAASDGVAIHTYSPAPRTELVGPSFGAFLQFTHKRSINGGPTWTQIHFHGPTPATGLLNWGRLSTNQLTVAFASGPLNPLQVQEVGHDASSEAADALLSNILIQNIGITRQ